MNVEEIRDHCLSLKGVSESFPFDETTLVFKVMNKMFCLLGLDDYRVSLKNDPEKNLELRSRYPAIIEGYHLNKQHWNTIGLDGSVPSKLLQEMINKSYQIIVDSLPRKTQAELNNI